MTVSTTFLTNSTGDPFADAGGYVIKTLWEQPHLKDKTILYLIEYLAKIYVNRWSVFMSQVVSSHWLYSFHN